MKSLEVEYDQGLRAYAQAVDVGDAELQDLGFPPAQRPIDNSGELASRPNIPANLNSCDIGELVDMLGYATAWYRYALELLPAVASEKNAAETAKDFAWAKIRKSQLDGTVADKDDATRTDVRYVQASAHFETCDYKYRRIKAITDGLLREIETVSRAMSGKEYAAMVDGASVSATRQAYRSGRGHMPHKDPMATFRARPSKT